LLQESGRIENMKAYTGTPYDYSVEKTMGLQYLFLDKTVWARRLGAIGRWGLRMLQAIKRVRF